MFIEQLKRVVENTEGGVGALVMGLDGIAVETFVRPGSEVDINTIGMEFSFILTQVKKAAEILKVGQLDEISIKAEQLILVIRMLSDDYFVAVTMSADGNFGKCRFLLRLVAPQLIAQL